MDVDFYERLYSGLGVEYFVIAQLFAMGYEAFKMPADFGFDIMVYNQRERSFQDCPGQSPQVDQKSKALQIKSRLIFPNEYQTTNTDAGLRKVVVKDFELKKSELEKLLKEENAFLICCFREKNNSGFTVVGYFWLSNTHLKQLKESGYIRYCEDRTDKVYIRARFRTQAFLDERYRSLLLKVEDSNLDEDTKESLKWLIERTTNAINMNSNIYIQLAREDRTPAHLSSGQHFDVWVKLPDDLYSFGNLDRKVPLSLV